jgi:hypothetical protein
MEINKSSRHQKIKSNIQKTPMSSILELNFMT